MDEVDGTISGRTLEFSCVLGVVESNEKRRLLLLFMILDTDTVSPFSLCEGEEREGSGER